LRERQLGENLVPQRKGTAGTTECLRMETL
jgi:hypothetical protein